MPRLFCHAQVDGMPAHSSDVERAIRSVARQCMDAHVQLKGRRGMAAGSGKTTIAASAKRRGMSAGRAAVCAIADPGRSMLDGPPAAADLSAWLPPGGGGTGSSGAG